MTNSSTLIRSAVVAVFFLIAASIAVAESFYVSNSGNNTISLLSSSGSVSLFASGIPNPQGLALNRDGNLFVASHDAAAIYKVTPTGTVSLFTGGVGGVFGVAFDSAGVLYAAGNNTISKISPLGVVTTFVTLLDEQLFGLAFGSDGDLYVSTDIHNTITRVTGTGIVTPFASGQGISFPQGLEFGSDGLLYVSQAGNTILKIDSFGNASTFSAGEPGTTDVAFDSNGFLYSANAANGTVTRIPPTGGSGSTFAFGLNQPAFIIPVPEPSSAILLCLGGMFLTFRRGRDVQPLGFVPAAFTFTPQP